jgi:hypothetical protein
MSDQPKPFSIDLGSLKTRRKETTLQQVHTADELAEEHGFVAREGQGRRGRRPSPRTGQVHAKVMPYVADEIAEEARRRGVQQGVLIEEAWELYKDKSGF